MAERTAILIDSEGNPVGNIANPIVVVASGLELDDTDKIEIPGGSENERMVLFSLDANGERSFTSDVGIDASGRFDFGGKVVVNGVIDCGDLEE